MMFDSAGKLTWAPENLAFYSATYSNAWWTKTGLQPFGSGSVSDTTATLDPFGGNEADLLLEDTSTGVHRIQSTSHEGNPGELFILSAYVKAAGRDYVVILSNYNDTSGAAVLVNLITGAVTTIIGSPLNAIATDAGNGWWRISFKTTKASTSPKSVFIYSAINGGTLADATSFTGDAAKGVYVFGAQFERVTYETSPRTYNPTTSAAYYGPRFDYDPATLDSLGLLLEGTRTNVALWCRDLTNAAWTKTNITAAKDQTGIDGVASSASKITATAGNGTILQAITLASSTRFQSAWVKRVTGSGVVEMTTDNGTTWKAITVTAGWTKVTIPTQTLANPTVGFRIVTSGDAIAVDFVHNENGTYASSAIWTTTAAVTRASDVCQIVGTAAAAFSNNYGAVVVQFRGYAPDGDLPRVVSGSAINNSYLQYSQYMYTYNGTLLLSSAVLSNDTFKRFGFAWDKVTPGRRIQGTGGVLVGDANTPSIGATTQWLGSINGTSGYMFGHIQSIAFYNQNLTDAQLASKLTVDGSY